MKEFVGISNTGSERPTDSNSGSLLAMHELSSSKIRAYVYDVYFAQVLVYLFIESISGSSSKMTYPVNKRCFTRVCIILWQVSIVKDKNNKHECPMLFCFSWSEKTMRRLYTLVKLYIMSFNRWNCGYMLRNCLTLYELFKMPEWRSNDNFQAGQGVFRIFKEWKLKILKYMYMYM